MQPRRIRIAVLVVAALLLLALGSGTALLLDRMHATAEAAARQTVQRITRVAESTVNRHFLAVDGMLAGLPAILGQLVQNEQVEASAAIACCGS
ncbi:hypothetical protein ACFQY5_25500 [Paeniroseomonas aquatica]|uniref:hypothetical protein n=1 Tax=Paeniroseomonas aquatica TaxID=373043 RepID=UPI00361A1D29